MVFGNSNKASGGGSIAVGNGNSVIANNGIGVGFGNTVTGEDSGFAAGMVNDATGDLAVAVGIGNDAGWEAAAVGLFNQIGNGAMAFGVSNWVKTGAWSSDFIPPSGAFGYYNEIDLEAINSFAFGRGNTINADDAAAFGHDNTIGVNAPNSSAFGQDNVVAAASAMVVGAGISNSIESSMMIGPSDLAKITILPSGEVVVSGNIVKAGGGTVILPASGTLTLPAAGGTLVTTSGTQTITGNTTFTGTTTTGALNTANVGIGATAPTASKLAVETAAIGSDRTIATFTNTNSTAASSVSLALKAGNHTGNVTSFADSYGTASLANSTGILVEGGATTSYLGAWNDGTVRFHTGAFGTERVRIDTAGNVGIGTVSPLARLQASAPSASSAVVAAGTIDGSVTQYLTNSDKNYGLLSGVLGDGSAWLQAQRVSGAATTYPLLLNPNGGSVGIGMTGPARRLDIVGTNATQFRLSNTTSDATLKNGYIQGRHYTNSEEDVLGMLIQSSATANDLYIGGASTVLNAATAIHFFTAANNTTLTGTERMTINGSGNVSIGGSNVSGSRLEVAGASGVAMSLYNTGNTSGDVSQINLGANASIPQGGVQIKSIRTSASGANTDLAVSTTWSGVQNEWLRITSDGKINLGATVPSEKLNVEGNIKLSGNLVTSGGTVYLPSTGTLLTTTGSGASLTNLNANALSTGTVPATQLPTITPNKGGTGITGYATGDLLYASSSSTLAPLSAVAAGNVLVSGGTGSAPAWNKVGLSTHVAGTLPVTNGGTGSTDGSITGTGALTFATGGTNTSITLTPNGTGVTTTAKPVILTGMTESTSPTTGELVVAGGAGINGDVNINGDLAVNGMVTKLRVAPQGDIEMGLFTAQP